MSHYSSPSLSDLDEPTQPVAAAAAPTPPAAPKKPTAPHRLKRCNAVSPDSLSRWHAFVNNSCAAAQRALFLDEEAEVSGDETPDYDVLDDDDLRDMDLDGNLKDFVVPDHEPIVIDSDSEHESSAQPARAKRPVPEEPQRMLLDEEMADAPAAPPSAKAPRAEPAPAPDELVPDLPVPSDETIKFTDEEYEPIQPKKKSATYERWVLTVFPVPGETYRPTLKDWDAAYIVYTEELAPRTGERHLHIYVRFNCKKTWDWVNAHLNNKYWRNPMNFGPARHSEADCVSYCSKKRSRAPGTDPVFLGEPKRGAGVRGHRSDLDEVADKIMKENADRYVIASAHPKAIILHDKGVHSLIAIRNSNIRNCRSEQRTLRVIVIWGDPDTGKTHRIREQYEKGQALFQVKAGRDPWGEYNGEEAIFFDEFGQGQKWDIDDMKEYLQGWPCKLDSRYHDKWAAWTRVYVISNQPPNSWYAMRPLSDLQAFWRRVNEIHHVLRKTWDAATGKGDPLYNAARDDIIEQPPVALASV